MKVSIITPVFNGEDVIVDAINSVALQAMDDWEWIIVNDGSNDATASLLDRLEDSRIQVLHQSNYGVSAARNAALDCAQGDYVAFLDADDILPQNALKARCDYLDSTPQVDIVHGSVKITRDGIPVRLYRPDLKKGPLLRRLARLDEGVFFSPNYMIRRSKIGCQRFPEGVSHCEDLIFFLSLAYESDLFYGAVPDVVYEYRLQPQSAMSNLDGIERGYLELVRRSGRMIGIDDEARGIQIKRVRRILFRSWLRRGRPVRAISALLKLREAARVGVKQHE